jgi:glycosyltransferase involved in cell wall biosynthesis
MHSSIKQIVLLPAAPGEGWASMDRYWWEMERMNRLCPMNGAMLKSPFPQGPPSRSRRASRWRRAFVKYLVYPSKVRTLRGVQAVHLLDHSYAHLLKFLPPGVRSAVTVHDLVPLMDPRGLSPSQVRRWTAAVRNLIRADLIIAISKPVADELIRRLQIPPTRIRLINMGVDVERFATPRNDPCLFGRFGLPSDRKIILSVGSVQPRKNLESLPELLGGLHDRFRQGDWALVRCGERMAPPLAAKLKHVLGPGGFHELGPLYGDELIGLFQRASVYLIASILEGFNLTIMEAMAAGVPVLANKIPSNQEVGAGAVAYYEHPDYETARRELTRLLDDEPYAAAFRFKGRERVRALSWENHWQRVQAVYAELLARSKR